MTPAQILFPNRRVSLNFLDKFHDDDGPQASKEPGTGT